MRVSVPRREGGGRALERRVDAADAALARLAVGSQAVAAGGAGALHAGAALGKLVCLQLEVLAAVGAVDPYLRRFALQTQRAWQQRYPGAWLSGAKRGRAGARGSHMRAHALRVGPRVHL